MSSDSIPAPRHSPWLTANLIAQLAFGLLAMTICLPSMQDWPSTFGASQAGVQLTLSAFIATYGGLQLVWGPWSDRVGRKPLLLAGLVLAAAGSMLAALATDLGVLTLGRMVQGAGCAAGMVVSRAMVQDLAVLTLGRMVQGAGCAAGMVVSRAMVQDLFTGNERTRVMAFVGMTMGVCPPLATLVGGQLHVALGWQANFVLITVLAVVLLFAAWRGLPAVKPAPPRTDGARALLAGYGRLLREPAFLLYVMLLASTTATFYTFLGGAPIALKNYGVTPERMGWYIMCIPFAYIFGNLWTSRAIRRTSARRIMGLGQAWTFGGLLLVLALGLWGADTPLALALPLVLLGIGHGLLAPPTLSGTVGLIPALAGSAAAIAGLMQQFSGAVGAFVVGLVPHHGQVNLAALMLAWAVCGLGAQFALHARLART